MKVKAPAPGSVNLPRRVLPCTPTWPKFAVPLPCPLARLALLSSMATASPATLYAPIRWSNPSAKPAVRVVRLAAPSPASPVVRL